ncbi:unnamed protein product [Meganyctiphanes norvegica]|uniref:EF-hand domain-containing protein n=1 Tax=Meganyctiphanes norvegica TaxID=48144 RepID=A0AAV2RX24_MEGNR
MSSWLFPIACLAAVVTLASCDAGHFFAQTPKHLPRIGRRSDIPALFTTESKPDNVDHSWAALASALASADADGDGCLNIREVIQIPAVRAAILQRDPALLAPLGDYDNLDEESSRPQPRLLRFRK